MPEKRSIVINPQKILRGPTKEIPVSAIPTKKIQNLIEDMKATLAETPNGVGLAAPQVGESLRLFIASEEAEEIDRAEKKKGKSVRRGKILTDAGEEEEAYEKRVWKHYTFINPKMLNRSRTKIDRAEGCLSVPKKFGDVKRFEKITVEAYDENGKKFTRGTARFFARVIQHELDHLDGALFIDKARNLIDEDEIQP